MKKIVFILSYLFPFCLIAQSDFRPGYIIREQDTVKGFIDYRTGKKNFKSCIFRETEESEKVDFSPEQINGYGFVDDREYESIDLPIDNPNQGKAFASVLVRGPMSLYRVGDYYLIKKDTLITLPLPVDRVVGTSGNYKLMDDKKYVGVLTYHMLDCKTVSDKADYAEGSLTKVVEAYNKCKGFESIPKKNVKPLTKFNFQVFTGYTRSDMVYDYVNNIPFSPSYTVIGGAGADLSSPRAFDRVFLSLEAWYIKSFYQGYYEMLLAGNIVRGDIYLDVTNIKIPLGLRYNFKKEESTPFIRVGGSWSVTTGSHSRTIEESDSQGGIVHGNEFFDAWPISHNPKAFWVGAGYTRAISKSVKMFIEFRYEKGEGFIGTSIDIFSTVENYNMLLGLRF